MQLSNKPLSETMLINIYGTIWEHQSTMSYDIWADYNLSYDYAIIFYIITHNSLL